MILVVGSRQDRHIQRVGVHLDRLGACWDVLDLTDFPERVSVVATEARSTLHLGQQELDLADVRTVWLRRVLPLDLHPGVDRGADWWVRGECAALLTGVAQSMPRARWINPLAVHVLGDDGLSKLRQLNAARDAGLEVPRTLATNDPIAAKAFVATCKGVVYKAFHPGNGGVGDIYTAEPVAVFGCRHVPCLFQERVPKALDLRVTVVGDQVFSCGIRSLELDYRKNLDVPHEPHALPRQIVKALLAACCALGLVFAACDLILTPDGRYVFLEANQAGTFDWVEDRAGLKISEALALELTRCC